MLWCPNLHRMLKVRPHQHRAERDNPLPQRASNAVRETMWNIGLHLLKWLGLRLTRRHSGKGTAAGWMHGQQRNGKLTGWGSLWTEALQLHSH